VANEAVAYGYEAEDRHFVRCFLGKEKPLFTLDDGLEVVQMLIAAYESAEEGRTLEGSHRSKGDEATHARSH
jgi:predicted dehydrogenase